MRRFLTAMLVLGFLLPGIVSAEGLANIDPAKNLNKPSFIGYAPDRFIVVLKDDVVVDHGRDSRSPLALSTMPGFDELAQKYEVDRLRPQFPGSDRNGANELARYYKVYLGEDARDAAMAEYAALPNVERVEKVGMHTMYATPNDSYYDPYQWYHNQANDDDMDSPEAWNIQTGNSSIILAILDSGTRYYHRDLGGGNTSSTNEGAARGNMWINDAELNGSAGVDDDGNGYIDDWIGYDFIETTSGCWSGEDCDTKDNDPRDFNGHGTHTSGLVGMITNNGYGMAGVAGGWSNGTEEEYGNGVKVMPLRMGFSYNYLGQEYGVVYMDAAAEAFYYAADNGARIASCSWGSSNSGGIAAAADYFIANGGLIFVAAGNAGDEVAGYLNSRSDCISVAATDENDAAASFTTYGTWVDISAPGVGIYSTYHDHADPDVDYWASMDGTSMACPIAAGVAAMIWSQNPTWTNTQVEDQLYASAENIDAELSSTYIGKMGAGRVNLYNAVNTGPVCDLAADFSGTPTSGCAPLAVNFTDISTGTSIDGWSWTFGDGGTSTAQNPSYSYTVAGTYSVSLTVSSSSQSCNDAVTKTGYITVTGGPTAGFVGSPTSGTEPLTVDFTDQSTDATGWSWTFGDGGSSTAQNPTYTYNTAGTYTVTLTATNACGSDVNQKVDYITVGACVAPVADFSGSPTSGPASLAVSFSDLSTGSPTSWSWTFGDGGSSAQQNPTYSYTTAGTYTVSMTATNSCGSDIVTKVDYITVTEPQGAKAFAQSDISVLGTYAGSYTDTYVSDNVYEVISEALSTTHPRKTTSNAEHKWTFNVASGGSNYSFFVEAFRSDNVEGDDFVFAYSTDDATYVDMVTVASSIEQVYSAALPNLSGTVYVRVVDVDRSWDNVNLDDVSIDEMYFAYETTLGPPVAEFSGSPTSGDAPLTVNFTDLSTGNPTSWSWDFGDGSGTSTQQNPSYTYNAAGTYTVTLTATNTYGSDVATKVDYITVTQPVQDPPVAAFVGSPTSGGYPLTVTFTDQSTNNPTSWSWDFGDGVGTSTQQNPSYTYNAAGTYTVSLTATNAYGSDIETKVGYITVTEPTQNTMHVHDIVVTRKNAGPNCSGLATIYIYDANEQPVANATVSATATGPVGGSYSGATLADGSVSFETGKTKSCSGEWCFEVTNVTHATNTYNAGANHVTAACESGWLYGSGGGQAILTNPLPTEYGLSQNHPNPFNPTTEIAFSLPQASVVTVEVYNIVGQRVALLAKGMYPAGNHVVTWDATTHASGVYFYRVTSGNFVDTKKMVLLK